MDLYPKPPSLISTFTEFDEWAQNVTLKKDFDGHLADYAKYVPQPIYNVKGFGAKGDGVTDDTAALQAAIDAAGLTESTVVIPADCNILVTATITNDNKCSIIGLSKDTSVISGAVDVLLSLDNCQNKRFENFKIQSTLVGGTALRIRQTGTGSSTANKINNLFIQGAGRGGDSGNGSKGIYLVRAASGYANYFHTISNCRITGFETGIYEEYNANAQYFKDNSLAGCWEGYYIKGLENEFFGGFFDSMAGTAGRKAICYKFEGTATEPVRYNILFAHGEPGADAYSLWVNEYVQNNIFIENIISTLGDYGDPRAKNLYITRQRASFCVGYGVLAKSINNYPSNTADEYDVNFFGSETAAQSGTGVQRLRLWSILGRTSRLELGHQDSTAFIDSWDGTNWLPIRVNTSQFELNSDFCNAFKFGNKLHRYGSGPPTTGTYNQGDITWNTAPAAAGKIGWVCVTGGTPGTWKAFGAIDA